MTPSARRGGKKRFNSRLFGAKIYNADFVKQTCTEIDPGRDMASERREDAAARPFDGAKVKGSRPIQE